MHKRVSLWLAETGLPVSLIRHPSFRALLEPGVAVGYTPPSVEMLMKIQREEMKVMKESCKKILDKRAIAGTITADGWTSASGDSYFGVLLHYVDYQNFMPSPLLLSVVCDSVRFCFITSFRYKRQAKPR
jgi:hypothetical protein